MLGAFGMALVIWRLVGGLARRRQEADSWLCVAGKVVSRSLT